MNTRRWWQQVCVTMSVVAMVAMIVVGRAEAVTRTWTGASSTEWSDAGNWGGTAPSAGDDLVFPRGAMNTNNHNDYPPDTPFASITAGGYTLGGNAIVLGAGGLTVDVGPGVTVNLAITLGASHSWRNLGLNNWTMAGPLHLNGATLRFTATQAVETISGTIDGVGAIDCDRCGINFSGANTYQGPTTIRNGGGIVVRNNNALGAADGTLANGTIVENGSALELGPGLAIGNEAQPERPRAFVPRCAAQSTRLVVHRRADHPCGVRHNPDLARGADAHAVRPDQRHGPVDGCRCWHAGADQRAVIPTPAASA